MQTIDTYIDHAVSVFQRTNRPNIVVGLTHADWDELCAVLIERHEHDHDDPLLTKSSYKGLRVVMLDDNQLSFVAHDYGRPTERRFPLETLAPA
jgi:hypothetical protein